MRIRTIAPIAMMLVGIVMVAYHFLRPSADPEDLDIRIIPASNIMPLAYKVYENPDALDGKYHLFRMILTNKGGRPMRNLKVAYRILNYIERSEVAELPLILPGQKVVVACYPRFKSDIVEKRTNSKETVEIFIGSGSRERREGFSFNMRGVNEFLYTDIPADEQATYDDLFDNQALMPCMITPADPVIKYYTAKIQQAILKGETAAVTKEPKEMVRFLMGIYQATLASRMVYSSTGGIPERIGDVNSLVQNIRLPREVVTGNTGLCIELSILYASVLASAGLEPYIFMVPGHAYPGIMAGGRFYAIEATAIGGEGIGGVRSAEQAFKRGMEELSEFFAAVRKGDNRYKIININGLIRKGALSIELKDDSFMKGKIDELFAGIGNGGNVAPAPSGGGGGGGSGGGAGRGWRNYAGAIRFNFPSGWVVVNSPIPGYPNFLRSMTSPDESVFAHIYQFPGAGSAVQAVRSVQQFASQFGQVIRFEPAGMRGSFQVVNGYTQAPGMETLQWTGFFRPEAGGMVGVILGARASALQQSQGVLNQIASSLN